ncbi:MAG: response regulator transcription factor [Chloroflexi bacterium]|nr:response regulator transcription factor [Chloroflexota bacterium]
MRILLADHRSKVRFALRALLEQRPGVAVVDEAVDAEDLLAQIKVACPDLVLLDWKLQGLPAIGLLPTLRRVCPRACVIVLSGRPEAREAALTAGADAFVSKVDSPERLLAAIDNYYTNKMEES